MSGIWPKFAELIVKGSLFSDQPTFIKHQLVKDMKNIPCRCAHYAI